MFIRLKVETRMLNQKVILSTCWIAGIQRIVASYTGQSLNFAGAVVF